MEKIKIQNFKGISEPVEIGMAGESNLVLFGDNGAGKTSLFEAIRLFFFGKDLIAPDIPLQAIEQERQTIISTWLAGFRCMHGTGNYMVEIDDNPLSVDRPPSTLIFMTDGNTLGRQDEIHISQIINHKTVHGNAGTSAFEHFSEVVDRVNEDLREYFNESYTLFQLQSTPDHIQLRDNNRNLDGSMPVTAAFNESKIKLARLLLFLENALALSESYISGGAAPILVLDDFVTSLDASNRLCVMRFIMEKFERFQMILMTHNASFFNLIRYVANECFPGSRKWVYGNLYVIDDVCRHYNYQDSEKTNQIKKAYEAHPNNSSEIANRLRRRFEILVHEFAKLTLLEAHAEMKNMLERILCESPVFLKLNSSGKVLTASDMAAEICQAVRNEEDSSDEINGKISQIVADYDCSENVKLLRYYVRNLKLYQKVIMHQGSHQQGGMPSITTSELNSTFLWMEKFEEVMKKLMQNSNPHNI